ncbi:MAG: hypothetical protein HYX20_03825 [Candidatus Yanofskybacteria bacterium]|nr:hypothetical protein [Candidatus Yanofskybacteria bacterium]
MGFESMPTGKISHEEAEQAQEKFVAEARKQIEYWNGIIAEHQTKLEEHKVAGNKEGVAGMEKLIKEAETEREKEESKIMAKI